MKVGVLGAGQLGRMLALAGYPLGLNFRFFDPTPSSPAGMVGEQNVAPFADDDAIRRFAAGLDVATFEFENIPVSALNTVSESVPVWPGVRALVVGQSRIEEKRCFERQEIPTAPWAVVQDDGGLRRAVDLVGLPAVLKTVRLGYDGKGQVVLRESADVDGAWERIGRVQSILERFVAFRRELSLIGVRSRDGEERFYPLVENEHRAGILFRSRAPAPHTTDAIRKQAESYVRRVMKDVSYVGVLALEMFDTGDGLLANELAPRVHNSGHWTIEGAETSQFENHLRAVCGMPLGSTAAIGHSAMINLIGTTPAAEDVLAIDGAHLHLYDKSPRPGRKLGHVTVRVDAPDQLDARVGRVVRLIGADGAGRSF